MTKWVWIWTIGVLFACARECPPPWFLAEGVRLTNALNVPERLLPTEIFIKEDKVVAAEVIGVHCLTKFEIVYFEELRHKYFVNKKKNPTTYNPKRYDVFPPAKGDPVITVHEKSFAQLLKNTSLYLRALQNTTSPPPGMVWNPRHAVHLELPYLMPRIVMFSIPMGTTLEQLTRPLSKVSGYPYYQIFYPELKLIRLAVIFIDDPDVPTAWKRARILEEDPLISDVKVATCYPMNFVPFSRWW